MHKRLTAYSARQCEAILLNYNLTLSSFDADALHDLRVAVKRIRAVFLLLERMFPLQFNAKEAEGDLRELFRLSGKMRDAQVQQQLLETYVNNLDTGLIEYQNYLNKNEKKATSKFKKWLKNYQPEHDLADKQHLIVSSLAWTDSNSVKQNIIRLVDDLLILVRNMQADQAHDEHLHEIRRNLKMCNYLLSVFRKNDPELPQLHETLKTLDTANDLLGDWHDRQVAMETLESFFTKHKKNDFSGENRYRLFSESLAHERHILHLKILGLFALGLKI